MGTRFVLPGQPQHVIQRGNNRDVGLSPKDTILSEKSGGGIEQYIARIIHESS